MGRSAIDGGEGKMANAASVEKEGNQGGRGRGCTQGLGVIEHVGAVFVSRLTTERKLEGIFEMPTNSTWPWF